MSARSDIFRTIKETVKELRGGKYFVIRGALDWANFPFNRWDYACAILMDETTIRKECNEMTLTLEMGTAMDPPPEENQLPEINDDKLDHLIEDASSVVLELVQKINNSGDNEALGVKENKINAVEFYDATKRVQGIIVPIPISY